MDAINWLRPDFSLASKDSCSITFCQRHVPRHLLTEVFVEANLLGFFGIKHLEINRLFLRQHPEQRCVVLNGVGAEDGEAFHGKISRINRSTGLQKLPALFSVECSSRGFEVGCPLVRGITNEAILSSN